jgi:plasmid maintenance system antidote protein VapI
MKPVDASTGHKPIVDLIREQLAECGLSQRNAAEVLGIDERTMRRYCSGDEPVPRVVVLALERLVDMRREVKPDLPASQEKRDNT